MAIATTPEYEELFARGYPHLRRLITPHPDEAEAETHATKALAAGDPGRYGVDWPASVAFRYLRGYAGCRIERREPPRDALADGSPIGAREARAIVTAMLHPDHYDRYAFHTEHAVFLLEAILGTEALVDAVLSEFEAMGELDATYSTRNHVAYELGFAIRRLPAKPRAAAEARVRQLVATKPESYTRDFLSYLVGGRAALEASGRKLGLYNVHFCDDPALVRALAEESCAYWDAAHVVLGGEATLDALARQLRKLSKFRRPHVIEELSHLASPKVVPILQELAATKALAPLALAALATRGLAPGNKPPAKKPPAKQPPAKKPPAKKPSAKKAPAKKR